MTVPKSRHSNSKTSRRRSHLFLKSKALSVCVKCGKPVLSHRVCSSCGYYKGKMVVNVLEKMEKKERKQKEKEMKARENREKEKSEEVVSGQE